jgi:hypothetical protein
MIKCTLIVLCSTRLYPVVEPYARALDSRFCGTRPFITCLSFWVASFGSISSSDQTIDISKCHQGRTKSPSLANRCIHLALKFHSQSIVILMLRPLSCVHHSKPSFQLPPTLTHSPNHSLKYVSGPACNHPETFPSPNGPTVVCLPATTIPEAGGVDCPRLHRSLPEPMEADRPSAGCRKLEGDLGLVLGLGWWFHSEGIVWWCLLKQCSLEQCSLG